MEEDLPQTLSIIEARVLGCLCEKETTTPDYYPLSLNALTNACNQKSNRSPVMDLDEDAVSASLDSLRQKGLISIVSQSESRVPKYRHKFENVRPVTPSEKAIVTELLIRGPQTAGELRSRCERMQPLGTVNDAHELLDSMAQTGNPLVTQLPRLPGKKDHRYAHTLCGEPDLSETPAASAGPLKVDVEMTLPPEVESRLQALEQTTLAQAETIESLKSELQLFKAQFE